MKGSSLILSSTEAPRDSFTTDGDAPGISDSLGNLHRSPDPRSTYVPGSLMASQVTSLRAYLRDPCTSALFKTRASY